MKWTIEQLNKIANELYIEENVIYDKEIHNDFHDLNSIDPVRVEGSVMIIDESTFMFNLSIKTSMNIICSVTLDEVPFEMDFQTDIIFSNSTELEDVYLIDGITIDLKDAIFAELIVRKPSKVVKQGSEDIYKSLEDYLEETSKPKKNNIFDDLNDFFEEEE